VYNFNFEKRKVFVTFFFSALLALDFSKKKKNTLSVVAFLVTLHCVLFFKLNHIFDIFCFCVTFKMTENPNIFLQKQQLFTDFYNNRWKCSSIFYNNRLTKNKTMEMVEEIQKLLTITKTFSFQIHLLYLA